MREAVVVASSRTPLAKSFRGSLNRTRPDDQAAHCIRRVGRIGLPASERKAAEHGHAPRLKDDRFRETDAIPVAFKEPGNAHPPGMVATEAGVDSIDFLETVGESRGRQIIRTEPSAEIGERSCDRRKGDADQCESCQRADLAEVRSFGFRRC